MIKLRKVTISKLINCDAAASEGHYQQQRRCCRYIFNIYLSIVVYVLNLYYSFLSIEACSLRLLHHHHRASASVTAFTGTTATTTTASAFSAPAVLLPLRRLQQRMSAPCRWRWGIGGCAGAVGALPVSAGTFCFS